MLFVVRDGRDVAVSMRKRFGDFGKGLQRWVDDNYHGLAWMNDPRVMMVRYEDLVQQYDKTMPRKCTFIGEPFEEGLISYHETPAYIFIQECKEPRFGVGQGSQGLQKLSDQPETFRWLREMDARDDRRGNGEFQDR